MASKVTRNSPVYWNNKKLGLAQDSEYDQDGAVTQEDVADGIVLVFGRIKTRLKVTLLSPPGGPEAACEVQEQGQLQILCEGKLHTIDACCTGKSQKSDAAKGANMVTWNFVGGEPRKN